MAKCFRPLSQKAEQFLGLYIKTGNATESAMQVFDCKSRVSAQVVGSIYLKRMRPFIQMVLEEKGYTYGKMLDIAIQKTHESKTPEWWDRLMYIGRYSEE